MVRDFCKRRCLVNRSFKGYIQLGLLTELACLYLCILNATDWSDVSEPAGLLEIHIWYIDWYSICWSHASLREKMRIACNDICFAYVRICSGTQTRKCPQRAPIGFETVIFAIRCITRVTQSHVTATIGNAFVRVGCTILVCTERKPGARLCSKEQISVTQGIRAKWTYRIGTGRCWLLCRGNVLQYSWCSPLLLFRSYSLCH